MNDETTTPQPPARRLERSSQNRVLTGVSGGLGRYFGIDPIIFRIGFVVSLFLGGFGGLAYLLLSLFVPTDGEPDWAQRFGGRLQRAGFWRGLGMVLLAGLAVAGLFAIAASAALAVGLGWGVPVGIGVIAIGAVLVLTAFRGGRARWLIGPAVALVAGAGVAAAADLDLRGGIGEREYNPVSAQEIPSGGYKLGVGHLVVDLRGIDWQKAEGVNLKVRLGTGQADVFVPESVCVSGPTHVGVGESEVAGERNDGIDIDHAAGVGSSAQPRLDIDARVDIGQLRVVNSDTAEVDNPGYGPGPFHEDTAPQRAAEAKACAKG